MQIRLQTQQAPNLSGFGVYDASAHKICRIRIDFLKECRTKSNNLLRRKRRVKALALVTVHLPQGCPHSVLYLRFSDLCVHWMLCFENVLHFLLWTVRNSTRVSVESHTRDLQAVLSSNPCCPSPHHNRALSLAQLLPTLKEILRSHFCGLKKFVERDGQLHGHVLEGATIPTSTEAC